MFEIKPDPFEEKVLKLMPDDLKAEYYRIKENDRLSPPIEDLVESVNILLDMAKDLKGS